MNFITKLFGKQAPSSAVVVDQIATIEAERTAAVATVAAATVKMADIAILSAEEHAAAEAAQAEGQRAIKRADKQIADLRAAQAEAEAREEREAFDRDVAEHKQEVAEVSACIEREYPELAGKLGALMRAEHECVRRGETLAWRGRKLETHYQPQHPETFRGASPQTWSATWPNPDDQVGGVVKGDAADAPRGMLNWKSGEPVPAREGVKVQPRRRDYPTGLLSAIRHLPGLRWGEPDFWRAPSEH